jgi:Cytochrome C'
LIAETGNLLLMRPPKNQGRETWMSRATELRESGTKLARAAAAKDVLRCRETLVEMAGSCNRCHETFRVATRIRVFGPEAD